MKSRPVTALLLALSLTVPPSTFAQSIVLPDIGDSSQQYLSTSDEHRLGRAVMQRIRERDLVLEDVQSDEYLNSIGHRIAAYAQNDGQPITFFWVRNPAINAFAAPGGFIGVNTGLLLITQEEDELAGVIAHELAHVSQRHIARSFADTQQMSLPMAAALVASALVAAAGGGQAGAAAMAGTMGAFAQHQINFTRANELEADRVGTQLLQQAGFDPNGMAHLFARLERQTSGVETRIPEFLLTHPLPRNRVADTQDRLGKPAAPRPARNPQAYLLARARLQALTTPNSGDLVRRFETTLAKGDYGNEIAERYGYALALKQAGRYTDAQQQVAWLRKQQPDTLAFRLEEADLALLRGDKAAGWRMFEATRELYPDDFTVAMSYGQALTNQGDPRRALTLLQPYLSRRSQDLNLLAVYAQAAQRAGDITTTHATLAEYYYLSGELPQAIEQAELGLKQPGASAYQQAQLRARLRQFKEEKAQLANR
jgi:predicted Zn-dependent protease